MALLTPYPRTSPGAAGQDYNYSGRPTSTWGQLLTASATPHSLGTKVVLDSSTPLDAYWVAISIDSVFTAATITDALVNIYLGGAGVEVALIPNLQAGWTPTLAGIGIPRRWLFPLFIPRGSRITADLRALIASDTCNIRLGLFGDTGTWAGAGVETLGATTASSRGTAVTPGGAAEGSWTTIATTGRPWRYILPSYQGNNDVSVVAEQMSLDIGTGSALIAGLENFTMSTSASEDQVNQEQEGRWVDVASGVALEARLQHAAADVGLKYVELHGVY